jgi:hypothetical protein
MSKVQVQPSWFNPIVLLVTEEQNNLSFFSAKIPVNNFRLMLKPAFGVVRVRGRKVGGKKRKEGRESCGTKGIKAHNNNHGRTEGWKER